MTIVFVLGQKNLDYDPAGLVRLHESHAEMQASYEQAARWTGFEVSQLLTVDRTSPLRSRLTLVSLTAAAFGIADVLAGHGIAPAAVGGMSLGAMAASALAGVLTRREMMQLLISSDDENRPADADHPEAALAAVLPLGQNHEGYFGTRPGVWFAGDFGMHSSGAFRMVLLAGHRAALEELAAEQPPEYIVFSDETVAVHTPLRHRARELMAGLAASLEFRDPTIGLVSPLEQRTLHTGAEVRSMFSRNMVEPVHTDRLSAELRRHGATLGVVLGPTLPRDGFEFPFPVRYVADTDDIAAVVRAADEQSLVTAP